MVAIRKAAFLLIFICLVDVYIMRYVEFKLKHLHEAKLLSCITLFGNQSENSLVCEHQCFVLFCFFLAPSMLDLAKLVEVTPQQAPCHPQTLADHTRHFRRHLLMVSADIMPLFGD